MEDFDEMGMDWDTTQWCVVKYVVSVDEVGKMTYVSLQTWLNR